MELRCPVAVAGCCRGRSRYRRLLRLPMPERCRCHCVRSCQHVVHRHSFHFIVSATIVHRRCFIKSRRADPFLLRSKLSSFGSKTELDSFGSKTELLIHSVFAAGRLGSFSPLPRPPRRVAQTADSPAQRTNRILHDRDMSTDQGTNVVESNLIDNPIQDFGNVGNGVDNIKEVSNGDLPVNHITICMQGFYD
ncbi:hypothetical protein PIB30_065955 [Stylosanthes scabra]|uniref:Uncharacterized protein n=1 Tax=Stylosanthes scabra TaxID=79078 RepID=A0ABU6SN53_9FABA|nr:hypothetical protein [Stylosanthes scabra]